MLCGEADSFTLIVIAEMLLHGPDADKCQDCELTWDV